MLTAWSSKTSWCLCDLPKLLGPVWSWEDPELPDRPAPLGVLQTCLIHCRTQRQLKADRVSGRGAALLLPGRDQLEQLPRKKWQALALHLPHPKGIGAHIPHFSGELSNHQVLLLFKLDFLTDVHASIMRPDQAGKEKNCCVT